MKHIFFFISLSLYSLVTSVLFSVYILTQDWNFRLGYRTKYTQILLPAFVDVMPCVLVQIFQHSSTTWHLSRRSGYLPIKNINITYQPAVWQPKLQNDGEITRFCLAFWPSLLWDITRRRLDSRLQTFPDSLSVPNSRFKQSKKNNLLYQINKWFVTSVQYYCLMQGSFIHSFSNLSDDRSNASSKTVPPHSAI